MIKSRLEERHRPGFHKKFRNNENLRIKWAKEACRTKFLNHTRNNNIIPTELCLNSSILSHRDNDILEDASYKLVPQRIKYHVGLKKDLKPETSQYRNYLGRLTDGEDNEQILNRIEKKYRKYSKNKKSHSSKK